MDDLKFVQNCVSGDKQSWDKFVDKYSRLIYNYIYRILEAKGIRPLKQEDINDIFQDIFLLLTRDNFKKLRTFKAKNSCSLASWLRQVTINYTIDFCRRYKPALSMDEENPDGFSLKDILPDSSPLASERVNFQEKLIHLDDCIEELDAADKYFLELYLNQGLGLEAVKAALKISRGAVDMRKQRLVNRLRECFKRKGFGLDF